LFVETATTSTSSAGEQACASQLTHVVVHRLARQVHAASDSSSGIRLQQCGEDFDAEGVVEQDGGLGRLAEEADRGARGGIG